MTSNKSTPNNHSSYYTLLGLHPSASVVEIRRAYRELSKRYHPDTTNLPPTVAKEKFHQLNEAYAILSNPERRQTYDQTIGYSNLYTIAPPSDWRDRRSQQPPRSSSAYLDPSDRPLSPGEIFALFILLLTLIGCLILAIAIAITRPETALKTIELPSNMIIHWT